MTKKCQNCEKAFEAARNDAKYCSDTCKTRHYQQRQKKKAKAEKEQTRQDQRDQNIKGQVGKIESENTSIQAQINLCESEIFRFEKANQTLVVHIEIEQINKSQFDNLISAKDQYIYETFIKKKGHGFVSSYSSHGTDPYYRFRKDIDDFRDKQRQGRDKHILKIKELKGNISINENFILRQKEKVQRYTNKIQINMSRLMSLDKYRFESPKPHTEEAPKTPTRKTNKKLNPDESISGTDLLMMDFETFTLDGKIGAFLGSLERYMMAIALTGDSGAGKSYFSFQLAAAFIDAGYAVKYYSLEMGLSGQAKEIIRKYGCSEMQIVGKANIKTFRQDAKKYDVLIVDSFSKLNPPKGEFDRLRHDFPDTIFISIFQKTNAGTMRGGSSILFDSTATIDMQLRDGERIAVMQKSRYGTIGWEYSVTDDEIIKRV